MNYVVNASYIRDYKIYLAFDDQNSGMIDLKETMSSDHRSIFGELINLEKFKNFKVDMDTIVWANGLDLAPEFLHDLLLKQQKNEKK